MSDSLPPAALRGAVDLSSLRNRQPAPAGASPAGVGGAAASAPPAGEVSSLVMDVTDETFGDIVELSRQVPVVVDLWAEWCGPCKQLSPVLERVIADYNGRIVLAKVDVDANPQLAGAFRAQSIPMVVALVGGQPVPLFNGAVPEDQVRQVFEQLLQVAAQNGVTGSVSVAGQQAPTPEQEPAEPPLPPLHQQAFDAIERGDYDAAVAAYEQAVREQPGDDEAKTGIAQVRLLQRVQNVDLTAAREAAAQRPDDIDAQLLVADLDVTGGHIDDAFDRLLQIVAERSGDERSRVRAHLVDLFGVIGNSDPRVVRARGRLSALLF